MTKVIATAALTGALLGAVPVAAHAASAYSGWGYYGSVGQNRAGIHYQPGYAQAETQTYSQSGAANPGWLGARGRLFLSNNTLQCEGGIYYNTALSEPAKGWSCGHFASGVSYYSYGVSWVKVTSPSPHQAFYSLKSPVRST